MPPNLDQQPPLRRTYQQYSVRETTCLSKDGIWRLARGETNFKPRLQVLRVSWPSTRTDFRDKFRVVLSDGVHHCQAMWPAQLNEKIKSGVVGEHSIVQLLEYSCRPVKRQPFLILQSLQLLKTSAPLIGRPVPHPSTDHRIAPPSSPSASAASIPSSPRPSPAPRRPTRTDNSNNSRSVHMPPPSPPPVPPTTTVVPRRSSRPAARSLAPPPLPPPPAEEEEVRSSSSMRGTCAVCLGEGVETVAFVHGRTAHDCCCVPCAKMCLARSGRCPICRKVSTSIVRVYRS